MKKIFTLAALACVALAANAQNETVILESTAMTAQTVVESPEGKFKYAASEATAAKTDNGPEMTFNGITIAEGVGYSQGSTNGMSWLIQPAADGSIDLAVKMGGDKKTYIMEFDAAKYEADAGEALTIEGAFAASGTATALCADFVTNAADYLAYPAITGIGTATKSTTSEVINRELSGSWDGTAAISQIEDGTKTDKNGNIVPAYANEYEMISIPVKANNVYIVGVAGSKLMVRAISYTSSTAGINGVVADKAEAASVKKFVENGKVVIVKAGKKFNVAGAQLK
jgi:hypothetical protein